MRIWPPKRPKHPKRMVSPQGQQDPRPPGEDLVQCTAVRNNPVRRDSVLYTALRYVALRHCVLGLCMLSIAACSTARQRSAENHLRSLLHYRDDQSATLFHGNYRSGNLYLNFRPALIVDAIVLDRRYRARFAGLMRERMLVDAPGERKLLAELDAAFDEHVELLVFVYEGVYPPSALTKPESRWRILLQDDEGDHIPPSTVHKLSPQDPHYQYIEDHFIGLDRWVRAYRLIFPKLPKGRLGRASGEHPFVLIFTGIKGIVRLQWDDMSLFYRLSEANEAPVKVSSAQRCAAC